MKILIVDDDREIRDLIKDMIDWNAVGLTTALVFGINGQDGWREFEQSQPDLVVTDCRMETPMAGIELAKKIKAASPATPVIMITAEKIAQPPCVDYIFRKPFGIDSLAAKIKELLEGKK